MRLGRSEKPEGPPPIIVESRSQAVRVMRQSRKGEPLREAGFKYNGLYWSSPLFPNYGEAREFAMKHGAPGLRYVIVPALKD